MKNKIIARLLLSLYLVNILLCIVSANEKVTNEAENNTTIIETEIIIETTTEETKSIYEIDAENLRNELSQISELDRLEWFKKYKEIINKYADKVDIPSIYFEYSEEDIEYMERCVETECYDRDFYSKCNVASVILNRHIAYEKSIKDVITAKNQFAYFRTEISETTKLAVEYILLFGDVTNGCMAFRSDICPMTWYSWRYQFTDDIGHNFYK